MDRFSDSDMSAAAYSDNQHQIKKRWTWKPAIWESRGQKEHQLWIRVIVVRRLPRQNKDMLVSLFVTQCTGLTP